MKKNQIDNVNVQLDGIKNVTASNNLFHTSNILSPYGTAMPIIITGTESREKKICPQGDKKLCSLWVFPVIGFYEVESESKMASAPCVTQGYLRGKKMSST